MLNFLILVSAIDNISFAFCVFCAVDVTKINPYFPKSSRTFLNVLEKVTNADDSNLDADSRRGPVLHKLFCVILVFKEWLL